MKKTAALLGFGTDNLEVVPSDDQGRVVIEEIPELEGSGEEHSEEPILEDLFEAPTEATE